MKKFLAIILALSVVLSLGVTVWADEPQLEEVTSVTKEKSNDGLTREERLERKAAKITAAEERQSDDGLTREERLAKKAAKIAAAEERQSDDGLTREERLSNKAEKIANAESKKGSKDGKLSIIE